MLLLLGLASSTLAMKRPTYGALGSLALFLSKGPQGSWGTQVGQHQQSSGLPNDLVMDPLPGDMGSQECTSGVCRYNLEEAKSAADALLKKGNRVQLAAPCGHHYYDGRLIEDTCHYPGTMQHTYKEGKDYLHIQFDDEEHIPAGIDGRRTVKAADKDKVTASLVPEPNAFQKACRILKGAEGQGVCSSFRDLLVNLMGATPTNNGDCPSHGCGEPGKVPMKGAFVNGVLLIAGMTQEQAKQAHQWLRQHDSAVEPTYSRHSSHPGMYHGADLADTEHVVVYKCPNKKAHPRGQKGCEQHDTYRTVLTSVPKPYKAGDNLNAGESSIAVEGDGTYNNGKLREFAYGGAEYANDMFFIRIKPESWGMKKPKHIAMHTLSLGNSWFNSAYKKEPQYYGDGHRIKGNGNGCLTVDLSTNSVHAWGQYAWSALECKRRNKDSKDYLGVNYVQMIKDPACRQVANHIDFSR